MAPSRKLGLASAAALVVGHTIGVGIFLTPAELVAALASPALTFGLWLGCGLLVLAGALTFGELASRYPESGGLYVYLRETLGPRAAFLYGWQALLVMDPGITAALATGLAQYVVVLWPAAAGHARAVALSAIWVLAFANMAGLRPSVALQNGLTAAKLLALAAIVVGAAPGAVGLGVTLPPLLRPGATGAPPLSDAIGVGLVAVFFSFGGFWEASRVAGRDSRPERTLPRALALAVAVVTVAYVLVTRGAHLTSSPSARRRALAADLARRAGLAILGPSGPSVLAGVVAVSVAGSAMALLFMAPRLYVAMSADGLFPAALAALPRARGAPARATAFLAASRAGSSLLGQLRPDRRVLPVRRRSCSSASRAAGLFVVRAAAPEPRRLPRARLSPATPALFVRVPRRRRSRRSRWPGPRPGSGRLRPGAPGRPAGVPESSPRAARRRIPREGGAPMTWIKTIPLRPRRTRSSARRGSASVRSTRPSTRRRPGSPTRPASIVASHSLIPEALHHAFATFGALMSPDLPLTRRQHEMITTVVSVTNRCHY